jgi:hypothetical protein
VERNHHGERSIRAWRDVYQITARSAVVTQREGVLAGREACWARRLPLGVGGRGCDGENDNYDGGLAHEG